MGRPPSLLFCSLQTPSCQTASVAYALCTTSYHRPHTDHTPTTYRLHTRPHTDHTPTTYRLHTRPRTDHTPTTYRLHTRPRTDCIPTTHRPRTDCIPTTHRPRTDCIPDQINLFTITHKYFAAHARLDKSPNLSLPFGQPALQLLSKAILNYCS